MGPKKILVTNDDGIYSPGIESLACSLEELGSVTVVAPEREMSGSGHGFTKRHPLRMKKVIRNGVFFGYSTNGTPADSVKLGLFKSQGEMDWIVSGINRGGNLGIDVFYSGTVAGALEGAIDGYPSAAFSLVPTGREKQVGFRYSMAAQIAAKLLCEFMGKKIPRGVCLNVNIPNLEKERIKGVAVTSQARQSYADLFELREDPFGEQYFWLTGKMTNGDPDPRSDLSKIKRDYITVTPLTCDLTHFEMLEGIKKWNLQI